MSFDEVASSGVQETLGEQGVLMAMLGWCFVFSWLVKHRSGDVLQTTSGPSPLPLSPGEYTEGEGPFDLARRQRKIN